MGKLHLAIKFCMSASSHLCLYGEAEWKTKRASYTLQLSSCLYAMSHS